MSFASLVPTKHSIATKLLLVVFSIYFVVAASVTLIHMIAEYYDAKDQVLQDLEVFSQTFEPGIANALWNLNVDGARSLMEGMVKIPIVVGAQVQVNDGDLLERFLDKNTLSKPTGLIRQELPIHVVDEGESFYLGTVTLYSSRSVVFAKVKYGFFFIVANSIIKTVALWIIFLVVARRLLGRPLTQFTKSVEQLEVDQLENCHVDIKTDSHNEIKVLEKAFNSMIAKLLSSRQAQERQNEKLSETAQALSRSNQRLELLLESSREMSSVYDKFSAMTHATDILLQEIPLLRPKDLLLIFEETVSSGKAGHVHFRLPVQYQSEDYPQLKLDNIRLIQHYFSDTLPLEADRGNDMRAESYCRCSEDTLNVFVQYQSQLSSVIHIPGVDAAQFTHEDQEFVETLAQFLAITLEDISTQLGLEKQVAERTHDLEVKTKALKDAVSIQEMLNNNMLATTQELDASRKSIEHLHQVAQAVNASLDFDTVLETVKEALQEIFQFDQIVLYMADNSGQKLEFTLNYGKDLSEAALQGGKMLELPLEANTSSMCDVFMKNNPIYIPEVDEKALALFRPVDRSYYDLNPMCALLLCPLSVQQQSIGTIIFGHTTQAFDLTESDIQRIQQYVTQLGTALHNAKLYDNLKTTKTQLEHQFAELQASHSKLADLDSTKDQLLQRISGLQQNHLPSLKNALTTLEDVGTGDKETVRQAVREFHAIDDILQPFHSLYLSEKAVENKRVLLAETNKKQQVVAKMALRGTGVELDIVSDIQEGKTWLSANNYDILCVTSDMIELATFAHQQSPQTQSVFMTSDSMEFYLPTLKQYPFLSNIVSRNDEDRNFTLKNITSTVSKITSQNLFGLEKYLNWGVEVHSHPVVDSDTRGMLIDKHLIVYLKELGVRRPIQVKAGMVAEELLMNAVYDAPVDAEGRTLYNHLSRREKVVLRPEEQGVFRYACDGLLLAVSVEDPFGAFDRETILEYLESCYTGQAGSLNQGKGGAGRGIYQIMETADLVVFNVKPKIRTEVIAIFNIDPNKPKTETNTSFHYFYG